MLHNSNFSSTLCFHANLLQSSYMWLGMSDCHFMLHVLNIHWSDYSTVWLFQGWCHVCAYTLHALAQTAQHVWMTHSGGRTHIKTFTTIAYCFSSPTPHSPPHGKSSLKMHMLQNCVAAHTLHTGWSILLTGSIPRSDTGTASSSAPWPGGHSHPSQSCHHTLGEWCPGSPHQNHHHQTPLPKVFEGAKETERKW